MILYIGNKLSKHGNTPTSVETLGALLAEEFELVSVSDKRNKLARLSEMVFSVFRYGKKIDYLLIDTYSTSNFYYAFLCALAAQWLGIRYIPILHGGKLPDRLKKSPRMSRRIFGGAWVNVAPSGYLYEVFEKAGFRVRYIPNHIAIDEYRYKERQTLRPRLLYVRAFSELYNPMMALEVLQRLHKRYPEAELCMVGPDRDGTMERTKRKCKEMGLEKRVKFMGKMDKKAWHELSRDYDIFINTTNADNTPVSLMEAMALGLPIVTTNVGGIPYLVEDGVDALCVEAGDAEAMYQKIAWLLIHPEAAVEIARNARKKAESFDWSNVRAKWIELLREKNR